MKKNLNIIVCVFTILTMSSCDFFSDKKSCQDAEEIATTVEGFSKEIKDKIAAQDTLMNVLVFKVDTLTQALTQVQKENAELKAQVTKLESPKSTWGYMTIASLALAIVALIVSLLKNGLREKDFSKFFSQNLEKSQRMQELVKNVNQLMLDSSNSKVVQSVNKIDVRLKSVEAELSRLSSKLSKDYDKANTPVAHRQEQQSQLKNQEYLIKGYANINSGPIFTKIFDSAQESCVFSIEFKSSTEGKFNIISLDKIKSRNGWQDVVEYKGSIEDATTFQVEEFGICKKIDDVTCQVTKKLKIRLIK